LTSFSNNAKSTLVVIEMTHERKRAVGYTIDPRAGMYQYTSVEGVGECRENFARLAADMERAAFDTVIASKAEYLFVDTSPMWMEKFIATALRYHVTVTDASSGREYDFSNPQDEADFRILGRK
jgi:hypothetical protein